MAIKDFQESPFETQVRLKYFKSVYIIQNNSDKVNSFRSKLRPSLSNVFFKKKKILTFQFSKNLFKIQFRLFN